MSKEFLIKKPYASPNVQVQELHPERCILGTSTIIDSAWEEEINLDN